MRLFDILKLVELKQEEDGWEDSRLKKSNPEFAKAVDSRRKEHPDRAHLGSGRYTYVDQSDSPHEMDQVERVTSDRRDGGHLFYSMLAKHKGHNNPFFPNVKQTGTDGKYPTFTVEKLYPIQKLENSPMVLQAMLNRYFTNPIQLGEDLTLKQFTNTIRKTIGGYTIDPADFKDKKLLQAAKVIQALADKHEMYLDLHDGNLMIRMTGNMPQLVLADPIYDPYMFDDW